MCDKGESRSTNHVKKDVPRVKLIGTYNLEKKKANVFNFRKNTDVIVQLMMCRILITR